MITGKLNIDFKIEYDGTTHQYTATATMVWDTGVKEVTRRAVSRFKDSAMVYAIGYCLDAVKLPRMPEES